MSAGVRKEWKRRRRLLRKYREWRRLGFGARDAMVAARQSLGVYDWP
ncbi:MAG: hypothetical protein LBO05_04135 [Deltaproteobacteria bacterium]|jgi:hypothetical protein|nr:hypothetical protein [Deltaproteobacteria bacterium]